jgi:hypothetical protein
MHLTLRECFHVAVFIALTPPSGLGCAGILID